MIKNIRNYLFLLWLFLLPWQTRWIYYAPAQKGVLWEYASLSIYGTELLFGIILFLSIIIYWQDKIFLDIFKKAGANKMLISFGVVLGILGAYFVSSINHQTTYQYLCWILYGLATIFLISQSGLSAKIIKYALWGGGIIQGALAICQFFQQQIFGNKWLGMAGQTANNIGVSVIDTGTARWLRAYGSFGSPNSLGIYLAVIFLLGLILLKTEKNILNRLGSFVGQSLIVLGLFFSFSRNAWLACLVGIIVFFILNWKEKINILKIITPFFVLLIIFSGVYHNLITARVDFSNRLENHSIVERQTQLKQFWQIFSAHPLLGVGPGSYSIYLKNIYPDLNVWQAQPVHNIYLLFLAEWGMAGVFLIIFIFYKIHRALIVNKEYWPIISAIFLIGLFDHWLLSMYVGVAFLSVVIGLFLSRDYSDINKLK